MVGFCLKWSHLRLAGSNLSDELLEKNDKQTANPGNSAYTGVFAGIGGISILFSLPADPKNSILFGFSLHRILEGLGLLVGSLILVVIFYMSLTNPDFMEEMEKKLNWNREYPWSLSVAWIFFVIGLFFIFLLLFYSHQSFDI